MPFGAGLHLHIDSVVTKPFFARKLKEFPDKIYYNPKTITYHYHAKPPADKTLISVSNMLKDQTLTALLEDHKNTIYWLDYKHTEELHTPKEIWPFFNKAIFSGLVFIEQKTIYFDYL